jgi:hypothetical protein
LNYKNKYRLIGIITGITKITITIGGGDSAGARDGAASMTHEPMLMQQRKKPLNTAFATFRSSTFTQ